MTNYIKNLKNDIPAALVVFLVALPLCMGIALASKAHLMSGIIAGIVGGVVVGFFSKSSLSVSGPAAGLTAIVVSSLEELKSFEIFLVAVLIAGVFQLILGFLKAGAIGNYVPSPVIKGMLAAIGIILILKQIPHALGYDADYEGDESFSQPDGSNTFSTIWFAIRTFRPAAAIITLVSVGLMVIWEIKALKKMTFFQIVPGALVAVVASVALNHFWFPGLGEKFALGGNHLAKIPITGSFSAFAGNLDFPDFSQIGNMAVWKVAIVIALIASLESLLSVEAIDKIDPAKSITPKNQELKAQGIGNIVSALLGGLPVTAVIVRSSANLNAGGKTKVSAILHGILLLVCVVLIAPILNLIPLAALAGILFFVGFKLTSPAIFKSISKNGSSQFIPFLVTIVAILFTDLLYGIIIGIMVGLFYTIKSNKRPLVSFTQHDNNYLIRFTKDIPFLYVKNVKDCLAQIPDNAHVLVDVSKARFIDPDVSELIEDFISVADKRNLSIEVVGQLRTQQA